MINKNNKQKGVTLIALIITILIMLILAGVCINVATNGDLFGKAEDANKMNKDQISQAEKDEENALKQNYEEFKVDENVEVDTIEAYEYIEEKDSNGNVLKDNNGNSIKTLKKIEYSLSKYLKENSGKTVYFKANTASANLYYISNNGVTLERCKEVREEVERRNEENEIYKATNIKILKANEGDNSNLVEATNLSVNNLDGFEIKVRGSANGRDLDVLQYEYSDNADTKNISAQKTITDIIFEGNEIYVKENQYIYDNNGKESIINTNIRRLEEEEKDAKISDKTAISKTGENYCVIENGNDKIEIKPKNESSIQNSKDVTLYIVREKSFRDESNRLIKKVIYMDDCSIQFYNPLNEIEIASPKSLEYIIPEGSARPIIPKYISSNGKEADVTGNFSARIPDDKNVKNIKLETGQKGFRLTGDGKNIYSDIRSIPEGEITDVITLEIIAYDVAGKKVENYIDIPVASNNFMVIAIKNNETKSAYYNSLYDALNGFNLRSCRNNNDR